VKALLLLLAACGTTDDRPETLDYLTATIFAPTCGAAECHSGQTAHNGYVFDTVEATQTSLHMGLIGPCIATPCDASPGNSYLVQVITDQDAFGHRMPRDAPLPNADILLIENWIIGGANGYTP